MTEQYGVATRLLYQLYIALQRKKKARLTGVAMEAMRPAAPANLQTIESGIYKELLKKIVPREADLKLKQVSQRYEQKRKKTEEKVNLAHYEELRKIQKMQQDLRLQDIEKEVYNEISHFEKMRKRLSPSGGSNAAQGILQTSFQSEGLSSKYVSPSPEEKTHAYKEYILKIHRRLEEDAAAREHREKRRRRVLLEQLKAHEAQEEAYREQQLVNRLMRQSQQERRMAVQLMHARHEKDIIRQNRIMREKQYEERRLLDFQEALDREAALVKQEKIDYMEQTHKETELHDAIAAEYAEARYRKHFDICQDVLNQIIDLVTKAGEYRELTHKKTLYEKASVDPIPSEPNPEQLLELEKLQILDDQDYEEFQCWRRSLKKGKSVPDEQLVDTIVEAISRLPAESGWVLDGFPVNLNQAKLLEKALSGIDPDKAVSKKMKKRKTSVLTTDPTAPKEPPSPPPVLDLAVLFDVSDNMVLRRTAGSTCSGRGRSGKKSEPTTPVVPFEPTPTEPPLPKPGSDQWVYVEETVPNVSVDRFQDTLRLLRDYYKGIEKNIFPEAGQEFTCIPLVDIINVIKMAILRIPLVPRRPLSSDQSGTKIKNRTANLESKDEMLVRDIWHAALTAVSNMIQELMALLTLDSELIDWHKFLLLAAQPWPYPSQRQLLQTLERFKGLDTDGSGFVTEEQFNKAGFFKKSVVFDIQILNDPTEPIPYDRMENLKKFFFMLFSDHQTSVKQLDYVNMLLYFAAHPDPVEGFYRALSVTTGEYITGRKTSSNLLKSVPNMDEIPSDEPPGSQTPPAADGGRVSLGALFKALCHGDFKTGDHNRFHSQDKTLAEYYENISQIYKELGYEDSEAILYNILSQHPFMLDLIENNLRYKLTVSVS
ncbi:Sperm flagellar protein 2 [Acipenser ruthenus]|uniref:Sperm flagellar protein 2 n=1 Tax=Acipenser ruthenus TaxID=7906 RepID=A0A662YKV3_ACIRT|nr:Sperm flagellar protein 2 [Acipenser ruthenus]